MRKMILFALCLILICMTGCWDLKDIETRGYVLGVAIDSYPPIPQGGERGKEEAEPEEEKELIKMELHTGEPKYAMTIQIPIIKKARMLPLGEGGGGGGEGSRSWEITQAGNSIMEMNREMAARISFTLYYRHLQVIVVSENVARNGLNDILDFFDRDHEMRHRTKLFVSTGEAKIILDVVPRIEDFSSLYLAKIPMNAEISSKIVHKTDLGEALIKLHSGESFVLPRVIATKDEIKQTGAAVFKDDKMAGWIGGLELEAAKLISGSYLGGVFTTEDPEDKNAVTVLEISEAESKVTSEIYNGLPVFNVGISIKGSIPEDMHPSKRHVMDKEHLEKLEEAFKKMIKKQCENTVERIQENYGADIFHFGQHLRAKKPEYWDKVKDNWNEVFEDARVKISVNVEITHTGNNR